MNLNHQFQDKTIKNIDPFLDQNPSDKLPQNKHIFSLKQTIYSYIEWAWRLYKFEISIEYLW